MKRKNEYLKIRFAIGLVSLVVGFSTANLVLFHWVEQAGPNYLIGSYARYVCAYGSFGGMIFGALLINDFLVYRKASRRRKASKGITVFYREGEKLEQEKRITVRGRRNRKLVEATVPLVFVLFMSFFMIAYGIVTYTATVNITPQT